MTDYRCMFSTSDRHRKLNQFRWQNMSVHLTNETSYWLKKLLMHWNWAIYNMWLKYWPPCFCFFSTLSQDRARPIPLALPEAFPQRSEGPVCARSPHRSWNGYPGCYLVKHHSDSSTMTEYRCVFSTTDRHRKIKQLHWQNMSAHLTNETSYWPKTFLMHLNWAIYDVCDINIDPHVCFFPDIVTGSGPANPVSTARGLSAIQREACMRSLTTQKPKRLPRVIIAFTLLSCTLPGPSPATCKKHWRPTALTT